MPTTGKQKSKARKSKESDIISDIKNLGILLGSNRLEREESEFSNSIGRPESPSYNALVNHDVNSHSNSREDKIKDYAGNGQNSREVDSSSELNTLSGELNQRIIHHKNDSMSSVSSQIQRNINEAKNEKVLPQRQGILRSGPGQVSDIMWEVRIERPDCRLEEFQNRKVRSSSRDELPRGFDTNKDLKNTHYSFQDACPL